MRKLLTISLSIAVGFVLAVLVLGPRQQAAGGAACAAKNGDVNADGNVDLSDAVTIIGHLFLGDPTALPPLCAVPEARAGLPATGQAVCYNFSLDGLWIESSCGEATCRGQDGSHAAGCPTDGRFMDNGDGTVTDLCTGLMWQQETADVRDPISNTVVWCDAMEFCENLFFAGYDDWRLPNARELQSIVDYGRREPAIDPVFSALPQYYWSSTTFAETLFDAWGVGFNSGYVGVRPKAGDFDFSYNSVRAVRDAR
jgi:hypothetical protein